MIVIVEVYIAMEMAWVILSRMPLSKPFNIIFKPFHRRNITTSVVSSFCYGGFFMPFFRENGGLI